MLYTIIWHVFIAREIGRLFSFKIATNQRMKRRFNAFYAQLAGVPKMKLKFTLKKLFK